MSEEIRDTTVLVPCALCGRTFKPESLKVHERICERVFIKKRKPFNSLKQRIQGTDLEEFILIPKSPKKSKLRSRKKAKSLTGKPNPKGGSTHASDKATTVSTIQDQVLSCSKVVKKTNHEERSSRTQHFNDSIKRSTTTSDRHLRNASNPKHIPYRNTKDYTMKETAKTSTIECLTSKPASPPKSTSSSAVTRDISPPKEMDIDCKWHQDMGDSSEWKEVCNLGTRCDTIDADAFIRRQNVNSNTVCEESTANQIEMKKVAEDKKNDEIVVNYHEEPDILIISSSSDTEEENEFPVYSLDQFYINSLDFLSIRNNCDGENKNLWINRDFLIEDKLRPFRYTLMESTNGSVDDSHGQDEYDEDDLKSIPVKKKNVDISKKRRGEISTGLLKRACDLFKQRVTRQQSHRKINTVNKNSMSFSFSHRNRKQNRKHKIEKVKQKCFSKINNKHLVRQRHKVPSIFNENIDGCREKPKPVEVDNRTTSNRSEVVVSEIEEHSVASNSREHEAQFSDDRSEDNKIKKEEFRYDFCNNSRKLGGTFILNRTPFKNIVGNLSNGSKFNKDDENDTRDSSSDASSIIIRKGIIREYLPEEITKLTWSEVCKNNNSTSSSKLCFYDSEQSILCCGFENFFVNREDKGFLGNCNQNTAESGFESENNEYNDNIPLLYNIFLAKKNAQREKLKKLYRTYIHDTEVSNDSNGTNNDINHDNILKERISKFKDLLHEIRTTAENFTFDNNNNKDQFKAHNKSFVNFTNSTPLTIEDLATVSTPEQTLNESVGLHGCGGSDCLLHRRIGKYNGRFVELIEICERCTQWEEVSMDSKSLEENQNYHIASNSKSDIMNGEDAIGRDVLINDKNSILHNPEKQQPKSSSNVNSERTIFKQDKSSESIECHDTNSKRNYIGEIAASELLSSSRLSDFEENDVEPKTFENLEGDVKNNLIHDTESSLTASSERSVRNVYQCPRNVTKTRLKKTTKKSGNRCKTKGYAKEGNFNFHKNACSVSYTSSDEEDRDKFDQHSHRKKRNPINTSGSSLLISSSSSSDGKSLQSEDMMQNNSSVGICSSSPSSGCFTLGSESKMNHYSTPCNQLAKKNHLGNIVSSYIDPTECLVTDKMMATNNTLDDGDKSIILTENDKNVFHDSCPLLPSITLEHNLETTMPLHYKSIISIDEISIESSSDFISQQSVTSVADSNNGSIPSETKWLNTDKKNQTPENELMKETKADKKEKKNNLNNYVNNRSEENEVETETVWSENSNNNNVNSEFNTLRFLQGRLQDSLGRRDILLSSEEGLISREDSPSELSAQGNKHSIQRWEVVQERIRNRLLSKDKYFSREDKITGECYYNQMEYCISEGLSISATRKLPPL